MMLKPYLDMDHGYACEGQDADKQGQGQRQACFARRPGLCERDAAIRIHQAIDEDGAEAEAAHGLDEQRPAAHPRQPQQQQQHGQQHY